MSKSLHVIVVEDSENDALLLQHELRRGGYTVVAQRVETADELTALLAEGGWELVLSDFSLPHFSGEEALKIVRAHGRDIPFIYVSGVMGEENAVAAMKAGAQDYVMKGKLARLVPAIERELRDAIERRRHREAEAQARLSENKYRHLFQSMSDAALLVAADTEEILDANVQAEVLFGRPRPELLGPPSAEFHPLRAAGATLPAGPIPESWECVVARGDGSTVPVHVRVSRIALGDSPVLLALFRDIGDRKRAEEELRRLTVELEERVRQRTLELEAKNRELERINRAFVGRELRMIELKRLIRQESATPAQ
ncbi:MAG TPA: response regulator [Opitutaceae bacterium]|nr:response regulator [Opitutaceae bacterium]